MIAEGRSSSRGGGFFATTQWSLVLAAGDSGNPTSRDALAALCEAYWYPVYAHLRHSGHDADAARDLTQSFFLNLVEKEILKVASPDRGRFRAFLKTALRNYEAHEREREQALKRGGGQKVLSFDLDQAEAHYRLEPADTRTPDDLFEQRWARALMTRALEELRRAMEGSKDEDRYKLLEPFLTGGSVQDRYGDVAERLQISPVAVRMAVRRLRKLYGSHLRSEIARTVSETTEIDDELRYLLGVVRS